MAHYPTPHINATPKDIAKTVLMPGDPLRSKFVAENFLESPVLFNNVRGVQGYTGTYKGKKVSVMASGMGMPSIGIYSYELFNFFGVENIIRIGSCGAMRSEIRLRDIILAMGASTDSDFAHQYLLPGAFAPIASFTLLRTAYEEAEKKKIRYTVGNVLSSDIFYNNYTHASQKWASMGICCVEMETAALYMTAAQAGKNALGMFTVSDNLITKEELSAEERQVSFTQMMELALDTAVLL